MIEIPYINDHNTYGEFAFFVQAVRIRNYIEVTCNTKRFLFKYYDLTPQAGGGQYVRKCDQQQKV